MARTHILSEIPPLSDKDCFYMIDRHKDRFTFPIHRHSEYELNLVSNCKGARRIVGDSIEVLGDFDLVLVGNNIEHAWEQHTCHTGNIREVTIQFAPDLLSKTLLEKNQFESIRKLLEASYKGVVFTPECIMKVYGRIIGISDIENGFYRVMELISILYELSAPGNYRSLASSTFANAKSVGHSRRVRMVHEYINANYRGEIRLSQLADIAGMTPTAFSRFFKIRTGISVSDYIIDVRLGHATRNLVDSSSPISEICFECGFNNVSNFNRIFRKKKGCSPKEFRETYHQNKVLS